MRISYSHADNGGDDHHFCYIFIIIYYICTYCVRSMVFASLTQHQTNAIVHWVCVCVYMLPNTAIHVLLPGSMHCAHLYIVRRLFSYFILRSAISFHGFLLRVTCMDGFVCARRHIYTTYLHSQFIILLFNRNWNEKALSHGHGHISVQIMVWMRKSQSRAHATHTIRLHVNSQKKSWLSLLYEFDFCFFIFILVAAACCSQTSEHCIVCSLSGYSMPASRDERERTI